MEASGEGYRCSRTLKTRLAIVLFCLMLLAAAVGAVPHDTRVKTLVETSYVLGALPPAYGNLTLPEPTLINDYLRTNTTLRNYLLPSDPPLQLIKCEAYLLQMGALFNFYVVEHTGGCQVPPPLAPPWPERAYSNVGRFWLFKVRSWLCSNWLGVLVLVTTTIWFTKKFCQICRAQHKSMIIDDETLLVVIAASFTVGAVLSFVLFVIWVLNLERLRSLDLPDPEVGINPFIHNNNVSLSLHRCTALSSRRSDGGRITLFYYYIGMPEDMCAQMLAARVPYGGYLLEGPKTYETDISGLGFISFVSPLAVLSCTPILLFEVIYLAFYVG